MQECSFIATEEDEVLSEAIEKSFTEISNVVLEAGEILAKIDHPEAREKLKKILESDFDSISLPKLTFSRIKDQIWRINDLKFWRKILALEEISFLPWKPGQELDLIEDRVVETVNMAVNKTLDEGLREDGLLREGQTMENDLAVDKELIPLIEEEIMEQLGRYLVYDFDTILEVADIIDYEMSEAAVREMEANYAKGSE